MSQLNLTDQHARMGKISNNLELHGEDDEVIAFAIPCELMLTAEQLDALMGTYFHRALFNTDAATRLETPLDGFRRCKPLELEDAYEGVRVRIDDHEFRDCRVQKFVLEPQVGGLTKLRVQVYLRPGLGDENLALQELQHREIALQIYEGKLAAKKNARQSELPLGEPANGAAAPAEQAA